MRRRGRNAPLVDPALVNNISTLDHVRMGALSVKAGALGTLYFDEFESRRGSTIGP